MMVGLSTEQRYQFEPYSHGRLAAILALEQQAHAHPWSAQHFTDSVQAGYELELLCSPDGLVGYFVAMKGVDEIHLLNLAVAPSHQGQGLGRLLLDALRLWGQRVHANCLWLEVRASNLPALRLYQRYGMQRVGERKHYYPADSGQREHAVVMSMTL